MNVKQVLFPTRVARSGMTVREIFEECSRANTPSLPFCDDSGHITGRVTLKNILRRSCLPDFMVELAMVLGEQLSHMQDMGTETKQLLDSPVDPYVQEPHLSLSSNSPAVKALAMMEQSDTSYIFVIDEGRYQGVVTIQGLASVLADFDKPSWAVESIGHNNEEQVCAHGPHSAPTRGFSGKGAIHPKQIAALNQVFTPSDDEIARARRVIDTFEAADTGFVVIDGKLIEKPVLRDMYRIVAIADRTAG